MAANPERGEVAFEAQGSEWVLRFSTNALCALEAATGMGATAVANAFQDEGGKQITMLRQLFRCGLSGKHPGVDLEAAGEILDDIGFARAGEIISEAFALAFPPAKGGGEASEGNPEAA